MAVNVGSLLVDLKTDTTKFVEGMNRANKHLDGFASAASAASKVITSLISVYAIKQLADFTLGAINAADKIGKTAQTVGLSAEAFQEYTFAADKAGISSENFSSALQGFGKRIGEARANTGTMTSFLKTYDKTLLDNLTHTGSIEEALGLYADAVKNATNDTDKLALSSAAFGRGAGAQLVNLFNEGAEAIDLERKRARELGGVLSNELVASATKAQDEFTNMSYAITGLANTLAIQYGPAVVHFLAETGERIPEAINYAMRAFAAMSAEILEVKASVEELNVILDQGESKLLDIIPGGGWLKELLGYDYKESSRNLLETRKKIAELRGEIVELNGVKFAPLPLVELGKAFQNLNIDKASSDIIAVASAADKKELEQYLNSLKSKEELAAESYARRAEIIQNARERELIDDEKANALLLYQQAVLMNDLARIREEGLTEIERFTKLSYQKQAATILGEIEGITQGVAQHNRTLFEINKVAAIANAIINAHEGASRTLAKYPWPVGAALAALHYAAGIAQVAAIRSTTFGGGGTGSGISSGGGAVPTFEANPATGLPSASAQRGGTTTIYLEGRPGDTFTFEQIDGLMDAIYAASERGDRFVISPNSRNAIEIRNAS